jgi:hypothetical protein
MMGNGNADARPGASGRRTRTELRAVLLACVAGLGIAAARAVRLPTGSSPLRPKRYPQRPPQWQRGRTQWQACRRGSPTSLPR